MDNLTQQQNQGLHNLGFTQVQINQLSNTYHLNYTNVINVYSQTLSNILSNNNISIQPIIDQLLRGENIQQIIQNIHINIPGQVLNEININGNTFIANRMMDNLELGRDIDRILVDDSDYDSDMEGGKKSKSKKSKKTKKSRKSKKSKKSRKSRRTKSRKSAKRHRR